MLWGLIQSGFSVCLSHFVLSLTSYLIYIKFDTSRRLPESFQCSVLIDTAEYCGWLAVLNDCEPVNTWRLGSKTSCCHWWNGSKNVSTCFVCLFQWCVTRLAGRLGSTWWASLCCWLWPGSTSGGCGNLEPSPRRLPSPTLTTDICKKNMEPHSQKSDRRYLHLCYSGTLNVSAVHRIYGCKTFL